jgi:hypothetical protein
VIDLTGEHARKLGVTHAALELGHLPGDLVDDPVVFFLRAEIEQLFRVVDVARELLDGLDGLLDARAFARDGLSLLLVVPKSGSERRLVELVDFRLQFRDVKDAPLAP